MPTLTDTTPNEPRPDPRLSRFERARLASSEIHFDKGGERTACGRPVYRDQAPHRYAADAQQATCPGCLLYLSELDLQNAREDRDRVLTTLARELPRVEAERDAKIAENSRQAEALAELERKLVRLGVCDTDATYEIGKLRAETALRAETIEKLTAKLAKQGETLATQTAALGRAVLYMDLWKQTHPEWNGNYFDDRTFVDAALAPSAAPKPDGSRIAFGAARSEVECDNALPAKLEKAVREWLAANAKTPEQVRHGRFPLGMVLRWIERAEKAEAERERERRRRRLVGTLATAISVLTETATVALDPTKPEAAP